MLPSSKLVLNPDNPRVIKDEKFRKLVKSLKEFPEMSKVRPVVVNTEMVILGGNMRFRAMQEAGWKKVPVEVVDWPEDKQKEFVIKDNASFGEWDWDELGNMWDDSPLEDWGLDFAGPKEEEENNYSRKIEAPIYEAREQKPKMNELFDSEKLHFLLEDIQSSKLSDEEKNFLTIAAYRHVVFNYDRIADFYAHSSKEVQKLMEDSALVIVDYNKAIEDGFIKLTEEIGDINKEEQDEEG